MTSIGNVKRKVLKLYAFICFQIKKIPDGRVYVIHRNVVKIIKNNNSAATAIILFLKTMRLFPGSYHSLIRKMVLIKWSEMVLRLLRNRTTAVIEVILCMCNIKKK